MVKVTRKKPTFPKGFGFSGPINNISAEMLEELIEQKYILPDDKYRDGPTATEILEAIKNHPDWVISGWMTSFSRNKQYIFINNCTKSGPTTIDEINDFVRCWRKADEIWVSENELFAGYSVSGG